MTENITGLEIVLYPETSNWSMASTGILFCFFFSLLERSSNKVSLAKPPLLAHSTEYKESRNCKSEFCALFQLEIAQDAGR